MWLYQVTGEEPLVHHDIQKRQLEILNVASGLSKCMYNNNNTIL